MPLAPLLILLALSSQQPLELPEDESMLRTEILAAITQDDPLQALNSLFNFSLQPLTSDGHRRAANIFLNVLHLLKPDNDPDLTTMVDQLFEWFLQHLNGPEYYRVANRYLQHLLLTDRAAEAAALGVQVFSQEDAGQLNPRHLSLCLTSTGQALIASGQKVRAIPWLIRASAHHPEEKTVQNLRACIPNLGPDQMPTFLNAIDQLSGQGQVGFAQSLLLGLLEEDRIHTLLPQAGFWDTFLLFLSQNRIGPGEFAPFEAAMRQNHALRNQGMFSFLRGAFAIPPFQNEHSRLLRQLVAADQPQSSARETLLRHRNAPSPENLAAFCSMRATHLQSQYQEGTTLLALYAFLLHPTPEHGIQGLKAINALQDSDLKTQFATSALYQKIVEEQSRLPAEDVFQIAFNQQLGELRMATGEWRLAADHFERNIILVSQQPTPLAFSGMMPGTFRQLSTICQNLGVPDRAIAFNEAAQQWDKALQLDIRQTPFTTNMIANLEKSLKAIKPPIQGMDPKWETAISLLEAGINRGIALPFKNVPLQKERLVHAPRTRVSGQLTEPGGDPLPGAVVTLLRLNGEIVRTAITNELGRFTFLNVLSGPYKVKVNLEGFQTEIVQIMAQPEAMNHLDLVMEFEGMEDELIVTAEVPVLDTTDHATNEINWDLIPTISRPITGIMEFAPDVMLGPMNDNFGSSSWDAVMLGSMNDNLGGSSWDSVMSIKKHAAIDYSIDGPALAYRFRQSPLTQLPNHFFQQTSNTPQSTFVALGQPRQWHGTYPDTPFGNTSRDRSGQYRSLFSSSGALVKDRSYYHIAAGYLNTDQVDHEHLAYGKTHQDQYALTGQWTYFPNENSFLWLRATREWSEGFLAHNFISDDSNTLYASGQAMDQILEHIEFNGEVLINTDNDLVFHGGIQKGTFSSPAPNRIAIIDDRHFQQQPVGHWARLLSENEKSQESYLTMESHHDFSMHTIEASGKWMQKRETNLAGYSGDAFYRYYRGGSSNRFGLSPGTDVVRLRQYQLDNQTQWSAWQIALSDHWFSTDGRWILYARLSWRHESYSGREDHRLIKDDTLQPFVKVTWHPDEVNQLSTSFHQVTLPLPLATLNRMAGGESLTDQWFLLEGTTRENDPILGQALSPQTPISVSPTPGLATAKGTRLGKGDIWTVGYLGDTNDWSWWVNGEYHVTRRVAEDIAIPVTGHPDQQGYRFVLVNPGGPTDIPIDLDGDGQTDHYETISPQALGYPIPRQTYLRVKSSVTYEPKNRNWLKLSLFYQWTRHYGNYQADNRNLRGTQIDGIHANFDLPGLTDQVGGNLYGDRRHYLALKGQWLVGEKLTLATNFFFHSGWPIDIYSLHPEDEGLQDFGNTAFFQQGRQIGHGAGGHTPDTATLGLGATYLHHFNKLEGRFAVEIDNVFGTSQPIKQHPYFTNSVGDLDPNFNQAVQYNHPRQIRLTIKLTF